MSELVLIFSVRMQGILQKQDISWIFSDLEEYNHTLKKYSDKDLGRSRVFEIGFGPRPLRLITMINIGVDAFGVDLDVPVLRGKPSEFIEMYKRNGIERVIKSLVRFSCFDILERNAISKSLKRYHKHIVIDDSKFIISDAVNVDIGDLSLDLIISEDVFEHIPLSSLKILIPKMVGWLKPNGLALIRPNIFSGITGGHLAEWFPHTLKGQPKRRKSKPWEHLRKRRYQANTYLNQLTRADYRQLFSDGFHILEERVSDPDLGREFLTPEVARDLTNYGEDELFSNRVLFVLKPKEIV